MNKKDALKLCKHLNSKGIGKYEIVKSNRCADCWDVVKIVENGEKSAKKGKKSPKNEENTENSADA